MQVHLHRFIFYDIQSILKSTISQSDFHHFSFCGGIGKRIRLWTFGYGLLSVHPFSIWLLLYFLKYADTPETLLSFPNTRYLLRNETASWYLSWLFSFDRQRFKSIQLSNYSVTRFREQELLLTQTNHATPLTPHVTSRFWQKYVPFLANRNIFPHETLPFRFFEDIDAQGFHREQFCFCIPVHKKC